jgi:hypothetical protein
MRPILYIFLFSLSIPCFSQKVLKLDTPKNPSKAAYYIGSSIVFKLDDNKDNTIWFQERILDFDTERGYIVFENWKVHYKDIITVKNPNARPLLRSLGTKVKVFGLGIIFFSTVGRLSKDCPNCNEALAIGAASTLVGWVIERFSGVKHYKIGKKNRLHLLDLTPKPTKDIEKV